MKKNQSPRKSLQITKRNNKKKKIVLLVSFLVILALGVGIFWWTNNNQNNKNSSNISKEETSTKDKEESSSSTEEIDSDSTKNNDELITATNQKITPSNTDSTPQATKSSDGGYNIPMYIKIDNKDGQFRISGNSTVQGATADGECYALLSGPNGKSIRKEMTIMPIGPSGIAYCQAQTISSSELSPGQWSATLNYKSNNAKGTSSATIFTVKS